MDRCCDGLRSRHAENPPRVRGCGRHARRLWLVGAGGHNFATDDGRTPIHPCTGHIDTEIFGVGKSSRPVDGKAIYFVLIAPVDLSTDGFKRDVKLVLQAVAKTDGGSDFSARILDDEAVASQAFSEETDPRLSQSPDEQREFEERKAQHLVAMYSGGLNTGMGYPYDISWYPAAASDTPKVGQYAGSEEWRP